MRPLPFATETGTIASSSIASNGRTSTTVTFTANRFTSAPVVTTGYYTTTANNAASGLTTVQVQSITSTGCTVHRINGFTGGALAMEANWLALQLEV